MDLSALPAGDLVAEGIDDLANSRETVAALAVLVAAPRIRQLGIDVPTPTWAPADAEGRLYELLARSFGDGAHGRFNALRRSLVSFTRAAACAGR